jgi:hypothetical protein
MKDHFDTFDGTIEEYRSKFVLLYIPEGHGLGNILIFICDFFCVHPHDGVVPMHVGHEYDRWLTFHFPVTCVTGFKNMYNPNIAINQYTAHTIHPRVRQLISPSEDMVRVIREHEHLVQGVSAGIQIRCGGLFADSAQTIDNKTDMFANRTAIEKFKSVPGPVFIASDSPMIKLEFPGAKTLDTEISVLHTGAPNASKNHRRNVFLDFFLLSMCPVLYITAGDPNEGGSLFSTFGYMAGMYGNCQINLVFNQ